MKKEELEIIIEKMEQINKKFEEMHKSMLADQEIKDQIQAEMVSNIDKQISEMQKHTIEMMDQCIKKNKERIAIYKQMLSETSE